MSGLYKLFEKPSEPISFDNIRVSIASADKIKSWSHGEVKKPETINYRSFKPEKDGLFCAKIFGPTKDWECNCGKYKRMKHRGIVCDKCGVEVIQSKVRRERMGHIELAAPVAHIWFLKGIPSRIGNVLDMGLKVLERVLYFESFIVITPGESGYKSKDLITEEEYRELNAAGDKAFEAGIGAEAIKKLLEMTDLDEICTVLDGKIAVATSVAVKKKLTKRLKVIDSYNKSKNITGNMILSVIPVLSPELRPLVPLDGGRFATSDLNDLYRRVINRNNRLKRLIELNAPGIIIRNEKRMLQEAVDALFDNGRRGKAIRGSNKRPLKSLSDMLKGKQGRFRQNLLGKRVDYSGRSVIVIGPDLKLHQCGIPKSMAMELFKPFIFQKLEKLGYVTTIKAAKKMVEKGSSKVWDILEEVIQEHPVLLNRAPTLHRLGIQAFDPVLVEGKAINLHPLVCAAFNSDFDGDQMAVHLPLSVEAQIEARVLMMSVNNVLSPSNGKPMMVPSQDIVLGCYWLTKRRKNANGDGLVFSCPAEVRVAYDTGAVHEHAPIRVRIGGELIDTTAGRVIFGEILPAELPFSLVNKELTKKTLVNLIETCYEMAGKRKTVTLLDDIKNTGFSYATRAGVSIGIDDMIIPVKKQEILAASDAEVREIIDQYGNGLITNGERYNKVIDIWARSTENVADEMMVELKDQEERAKKGESLREYGSFNPIYMMADSGARGSAQQIRQLGGMRGLMAKPSGEIIETPIKANFREGLTVFQYFISTHGARKGLADTALKTANSGYLTRRLVDVAQDVIITTDDCGNEDGMLMQALIEGGEIIQSLEERIKGRILSDDVIDPLNGSVLVTAGTGIDDEILSVIATAGIDRVRIRSILTCKCKRGICATCYGRDLASGRKVELGEAVGVIAAQSIGEPGTQLTMRTFHIGGTASKVAEQSILEARNNGSVQYLKLKTIRNKAGHLVVINRNGTLIVKDKTGREREKYVLVYGATMMVEDGATVVQGQKLVEWDPFSMVILTEHPGRIAFGDIVEGVSMQEEVDEVTGLSRKVIVENATGQLRPRITIKDESGKSLSRNILPVDAHITVEKGDVVFPGDILAKIPRETTKTKDITGGLPRVAELLEGRKPKEQAVISEIDGMLEFAGFHKGMRKIIVKNEQGDEREYLIPKGKHINVHEGDWVIAGEPLMDGSPNPHDILKVLGANELQKYLVNEVQEVYRLQGVLINDKHIEIIVRQMLKKIKIEDAGDTELLVGSQVDKYRLQEANEAALAEGKQPAIGTPILLGITKAALSTDSFISAASFQETTRVLTEAAVSGCADELVGLKENVIVGRLIPAGTGLDEYAATYIVREETAGQKDEQPEVAVIDV